MHLFLQGLRVESNPSSGVRILAGGKNLVLQGIRRHHSGNYTCTAFNLEGEDTSNPVAITVMCKFFEGGFYLNYFGLEESKNKLG